MAMQIHGYEFYVNDTLAASSYCFFSTPEAVVADMKEHIDSICSEICDTVGSCISFDWSDDFDPESITSCDEEFAACLLTYRRIEHMVNGCRKIYCDVKDAVYEIENNCPYEIAWYPITREFVN
jgi:hypothetical protein